MDNSILYAALWMALLVGIYITTYVWNGKTPKPEGCEELTADCEGCQAFDCSHNPVNKMEE